MKKIFFSLFCFFLSTSLWAQHPINARSISMGGLGVTFQDVNSIFSNQAGLAFANAIEVSVNTERRFSNSALSTYTAGFAYPTNSGTFGLMVNYFGFDAYNQQQIGMSYARKFAKNLSFGAQIDFHNYKITDYGTRSILSFQVGAQYQLLKDLVVGFHLANPVRQEIAIDENIASVMKLGIAYTASKNISIHAEAEQDLDFPVRIKVGLDYLIVDALQVRLGIGTNPSIVSFGMGLNLDNVKIEAAASYHQILGLSPGIGIRYEIRQNPKKKKKTPKRKKKKK